METQHSQIPPGVGVGSSRVGQVFIVSTWGPMCTHDPSLGTVPKVGYLGKSGG